MIPLSINIFERGAAGVPSTTPVINQQFLDLIESYTHTITDAFGFESMAVEGPATVKIALDWLTNGLMRSVIVYSPKAETIWEGFLSNITARFGQQEVSVSLDTTGNRVKVRYTTVLGTSGVTVTSSDTASQALYGVKDLVISTGETVAATAQSLRDKVLAERKNPVATNSGSAETGEQGDVRLTLTFAGWYATLDWVQTSRTSTTLTSTTTQVGDLIQTSGVGIGVTNAFLSTSRANISSSGITDTELIAADTSFRQKIEELLKKGNSSNQRLAWGVYENREFYVATWAGATPTTITYKQQSGDHNVYDAIGNPVAPWNVRPNAMRQVIDLIDPAPTSTAQDSADRSYVERVTCTIASDRIGVSFEPASTTAVDAMIARIG